MSFENMYVHPLRRRRVKLRIKVGRN